MADDTHDMAGMAGMRPNAFGIFHAHDVQSCVIAFRAEVPEVWTMCVQEKLNHLEAELGEYRGAMKLGWTDPASSDFNKASSVLLSNTMKTSDEEPKRKACWEVRVMLLSCGIAAGSGLMSGCPYDVSVVVTCPVNCLYDYDWMLQSEV